jgi:geranylgeranyl pyrophosphate synthase
MELGNTVLVAEQGNTEPKRRTRRRQTAHLKQVPESLAMREQLRERCRDVAATLDRNHPLSREQMEGICRELLAAAGLTEAYLGWTMVILSSEFWRDQVAAVPPERRLFLLPHCLKHAEGCPADYDQFGLDCKTCGACSIADFRKTADAMGYKVLVAEGSPIVLKIIVSGYVDAIVGVACLNVLEKAIDKILLAGIPCMAVPLLSSDCRNTSVDEDWVDDMVSTPFRTAKTSTRSYIHLLRRSTQLFEQNELERLMPRSRGEIRLDALNGAGISSLDPVAATETIAYDFLSRGGKYSRPFITLATWDALAGDEATTAEGPKIVNQIPDVVLRTAVSIETFHKASLVHDDIEDSDGFRYGQESLHSKYGVPTAINLGDYLIGLGYRLVSRDSRQLGAEVAADIIDLLADAHLRLSEGQGAELIWRDNLDKRLQPIDALRIYALKTAPAFEAALFSGVRLAGEIEPYRKPLKDYARNIGVAFQILNDLKDWETDRDNKLVAGSDLLSGRPTLLWALALESLDKVKQHELLAIVEPSEASSVQRINRARQLYYQAGVFEKAHRLVDKYQSRAEEIADGIKPDSLRRLLYYLVDTVLSRSDSDVVPTIQFLEPTIGDALPIVAPS